jgi:hypothetical protein
MSKGKAIVHLGKGGVAAVDFQNFSALERQDVEMANEVVVGMMFIFNSTRDLVLTDGQHDPQKQKLLDGVGSEVSYSCTKGWKNVFVTTFPDVINEEDEYPRDFTVTDEDHFLDWRSLDKVRELIVTYSEHLKKVRVVGIIDEDEYNDLRSHVESISTEITFENDSPYLVVV